MADWAAIGLRFAAYADLLLLAGLALGGGLGRHARAINGRLIGWLAVLGVVITIAQFGATCLAMMGYDPAALDREMLSFMAFETPMGLSHIVRVLALGLLVAVWASHRAGPPVITGLTVVALGSLAWTGHAGASEAALGWTHRASDIVHLLAAAAWLAALVMFARILLLDFGEQDASGRAISALERFSGVGAIIVGALVVTGTINLLAIVGVNGLAPTFATPYGRLLLLKLALFGAMLALASFNRWRLVPGVRASLEGAGKVAAVRRLQVAIGTETALAFVILAVVAILGTLSPVE